MNKEIADRIRMISFHLPQFHPIPENDEWWGRGFTEWRNVVKTQPLFKGHYQPHLPADMGFYDLRLPETRQAQADLAREYGIHGFCYYHYWFNGRRVLERPFSEVLQSGKPDFPFCLCWANENWTRAWDGGENHILLKQDYSHEDDLQHIQSLLPAFKDKRYIRIDDKPFFLVYRTELLPDPAKTAQIWRQEAKKAGLKDLYLARVEIVTNKIDPRSIGFDASVEFAPDFRNMGNLIGRNNFKSLLVNRILVKLGLTTWAHLGNSIATYDGLVEGMLKKPESDYVRFRCVTPGFDNSARRKDEAAVFVNSTPQKYGRWLKEIIENTNKKYQGDERIVFINAWNEWAEGNHLEPDQKWGRAYLEETLRALNGAVPSSELRVTS